MPRTSGWIHSTTQANMQQLIGLTLIQRTSLDGPYHPSRSSELPLEQYFGYLRKQFASSAMTCRDYIHAAARTMNQTSSRMAKDAPHRLPCVAANPVSDAEFRLCADRAMTAALELMAVCSGEGSQTLLERYTQHCGALVKESLQEDHGGFPGARCSSSFHPQGHCRRCFGRPIPGCRGHRHRPLGRRCRVLQLAFAAPCPADCRRGGLRHR